jgi:hypothetical protein
MMLPIPALDKRDDDKTMAMASIAFVNHFCIMNFAA